MLDISTFTYLRDVPIRRNSGTYHSDIELLIMAHEVFSKFVVHAI